MGTSHLEFTGLHDCLLFFTHALRDKYDIIRNTRSVTVGAKDAHARLPQTIGWDWIIAVSPATLRQIWSRSLAS